MKTRILNILTLVAVLLAVHVTAFSQVQPTFTTLGSAIGGERNNRLTVVSATGIVASTGTLDYGLFIDHEFMRVTAVSGTLITVSRGQANTNVTPHKSGATVFIGQYGSSQAPGTSGGPFIQTTMWGSCASSSYPVLPLIEVNAHPADNSQQGMYNCNNGQWAFQSLPDDSVKFPLVGACNIAIGSVAYGSVGTNSSDVANKRMLTSFFLPQTGIFTGIQQLQGGTATTDNITAGIYDFGGLPIANTGATGVLLAGANTFLKLPFTNGGGTNQAQTKTILTGPAMYFVGVTGNGATGGAYQTVPTLTFNQVLSQGSTSITFGTFPAIASPPTTFTADLAPVTCLYY